MDKTAVKNFAIESRRFMIESVKYQANLIGITADGIAEPISKAEGMETYEYGAGTHTIYDEDIQKRESLIREIKSKGFENVVEEVAYTWFNRIIAIRYMEINDYLPTRTRVLSSENQGKNEPDIITEALDLDLDFNDEDKDKLLKLKDENKLDELFQFLFIKQCNKLNNILPGLFEKTNDYAELLLNITFTNEDGVIRQLVDTISEDNFKEQVEIMGWLYQYYISEKKDEVINIHKGNIKKGDIPAATQLFTTDWVVKYMVDNSLGRYWIERNPNSSLKDYLDYYLGEARQDEKTQIILDKIRSEKSDIEDLTFFDPCMGSGHILVYAFDVFFKIYTELGYLERDIPELILKNNIFGLDIDNRAYQLAYFAVLMKARTYDRHIFEKKIVPKVYAIQESKKISEELISFIEKNDKSILDDILYLKNIFKSGKEFGSLIQVKNIDYTQLKEQLKDIIEKSKINISSIIINETINNDLINLINQAELLSKKYSIVVTNPPYMNKFEKSMREFANENYKDYSKDLFSMFIYRNFDFCEDNGYSALMTPFVWMFISSYESLRKFIINNKSISSLIQLEYSAFSEATVPICTFVFLNNNEEYNGIYLDLSEFPGGMNVQKDKVLDIIKIPEKYINKNKFFTSQNKFNRTPGKTLAYWATENALNDFKIGNDIKKYIDSFQGIITGKNSKFLRYWHEISTEHVIFDAEDMDEIDLNETYWIPYNKGGNFRKWYGNQEYVVYWKNGPSDKTRGKASFSDYYLRDYVSWSYLTSSTLSTRYFPKGFLWDVAGSGMFDKKNYLKYLQAVLTSKIGITFLKIINPTLNFQVENILQVPIIYDESKKMEIEELVEENINISKQDWDSFEISWNFKKHPLLNYNNNLIEENFNNWKINQKNNINKVLQNEIKLNEILIKIYNLENELDSNLSISDITLYSPDYTKDIKSFISYSIGCMFGRYSLDKEKIQFAGGNFNLNEYSKFIPDQDNIIPVLDTEYFEDDIVGRFVEFVKTCFGEETLEENLNFIANALNKPGETSRKIIRNYFLTDFFRDHTKTYKKCPIYWQFDSGRQNAFKCIVYMHRYEIDLIARIRTDYLHKTQKAIEQRLNQCENIIKNSSNKSEVSKATKDRNKYFKQIDEIKKYDKALAHMANQHIEIDLDDGVKVNYAKFQNVEISKEGEKTKKINLLKKI